MPNPLKKDNPMTATAANFAIKTGTNTGSQNWDRLPGGTIPTYTPINTAGSSSGGSRSGGSSSSGGSSTVVSQTDNSGLYDTLNGLYQQKLAASQAAYNNGINRLNDAYNNAANNYGNIYNRGVQTLQGDYNNSLNKINSNAKNAMQEAYINKMLSQKNLSQQLAAQGISGGASESTIAGLLNNYGNARNNIQNTWDTNRADLQQTYNSNLANLYNAYQQQLAGLDANRASAINNLENMLANASANASDSWFNTLMSNPELLQRASTNAIASQQAYAPTEAVANNTFNPVSTQQINDMGSVTQAARANAFDELTRAGVNPASQVQQVSNSQQNMRNLIASMIDRGYTDNQITNVLRDTYY